MRRYGRRLIGGYVALFGAAAVIIVLVLVFHSSRDNTTSAHKAAPAPTKPAPNRKTTNKQAPPAKRHSARPKIRRAPAGRLPLTRVHDIPWSGDGTSHVASSRRDWLAVYSAPKVQRPSLLLRNPYRIVVRLRVHKLELWKGQRLVLHARTVVGKPSTPTPLGMFYVTDLLRPHDPNGTYGPFAFNLSAHSRVLWHFAGGDGVVAIHGTDQPWLIGKSASHGCVRVKNAVIRRLAHVLPLGTPVLIRR